MRHTLSKSLWVLRNQPMARLDIGHPIVGEELLDRRDKVVADVAAPRAANKERRAVEADGAGVAIGEVGHGVERLPQHGQRHAELERLVIGAD
jgi:hypothetical protein